VMLSVPVVIAFSMWCAVFMLLGSGA